MWLCRAEKEAIEQRRADLASALQQRKASKKAGLQAEPAAGTLDTAAIRIRLPDGTTAQRRFLADESLQVLKACARLLENSVLLIEKAVVFENLLGCPYWTHSIDCAVLLTMATSMLCCQTVMVGNVVSPCRLSTILPILWKA